MKKLFCLGLASVIVGSIMLNNPKSAYAENYMGIMDLVETTYIIDKDNYEELNNIEDGMRVYYSDEEYRMSEDYERQTIVQEVFSGNLKYSLHDGFNRIGDDINASDDPRVLVEINNNSLNEKVEFTYAYNDYPIGQISTQYSLLFIIDQDSSVKLVLPYSYLVEDNKYLAYRVSSLDDTLIAPRHSNSMDVQMNIKLVK